MDIQLAAGFGDGVSPDDESNLALGADVSASGPLWPGFVATRLTDGDRSTISHPATPVNSFEYLVDLGSESVFDRIEIANRADGCCPDRLTNYRVTVMSDDSGRPGVSNWSAVVRADGTNSGNAGVDVLHATADPTGVFGGRFISVAKVDDGSQDYWPQIAEVEVYASRGYSSLVATNVESAMRHNNASALIRIPFQVANLADVQQLRLDLQYDDGFVAYLNGIEVARRNAPDGTPTVSATAVAEHEGTLVESLLLQLDAMQVGENLLAIHGLNISPDDSDFLVAPQLFGINITQGSRGYFTAPTPGDINGTSIDGFLSKPIISVPHGLFTSAFDVSVTSGAGETLVYTTDGSEPTLQNGSVVTPTMATDIASAELSIDETTVLRARSFRNRFHPSETTTHSYVFVDSVLSQPADPEGLPARWAGASADYEMDPDVVNDEAYRERLIEGLYSIPTLSIVTDAEHLWGEVDGIYIHSTQRGEIWERPISVELFSEQDPDGFQVDAGLRMWGTGWAPHSSSRKHSFQLKFKSEYGPWKT